MGGGRRLPPRRGVEREVFKYFLNMKGNNQKDQDIGSPSSTTQTTTFISEGESVISFQILPSWASKLPSWTNGSCGQTSCTLQNVRTFSLTKGENYYYTVSLMTKTNTSVQFKIILINGSEVGGRGTMSKDLMEKQVQNFKEFVYQRTNVFWQIVSDTEAALTWALNNLAQ